MHTTQLLSASRLVFCSLGTVGAVHRQRSGLRSVSISLSFSKSLANHPAACLVPCLPPGPSPPRCCPGCPLQPRPAPAGRARGPTASFAFVSPCATGPGSAQPSPASPGTPGRGAISARHGSARLGSTMPRFSVAEASLWGCQFVQFLQDTGREQASLRETLRTIYNQEFRGR